MVSKFSGKKTSHASSFFSLNVVFMEKVYHGLILHAGNKGDCLGALEMLQKKFTNFLIECPLQRRKYIGALALPETKHTCVIY